MISKIISLLFLLTIFLIFFLPIKDTDFGWHYRCGNEILNGDTTCLYQNTYTYYLEGYKWAYPRLIYDTSLSLVYDHFGPVGVSFLGASIMTISFCLVLITFSGSSALKAILISLSILGGWSIYNLGYRSQSTSFLFLAMEILILRKPKLIWLLPVLFAVWANTHPGFFLGPIVFALYIFIEKRSLKNIIIFIISCFATFINPYGWKIYEEVFRHFFTPLNTLIAEWVAPGTNQILAIIGSFIFLTILLIKKRVKPGYLFFLAIIFGIMAISARRNLPLYYFVLVPVFLEIIPVFTNEIMNIFAISILPIICLILLINTAQITNLGIYPDIPIDYFKNKSGNVFNTYEWGGFLIWKLPNMKFFVDGRMPAWPTENHKSPYTVFLEILQARPGWNETLQKYNTNYIFIAPGTFLDLELKNNQGLKYGWNEEYRSQTTVIYKKI